MIKMFYRNNKIKSRLFVAVVILFLFLIVLRIFLSQIIIYSTQSWLNKQGIHSSVEDIRINITGSTVSLHNANGHKGEQPLFDIGFIDIHWSWTPLSEKVIEVTKVEVDGLNLAIKQFRDEIIIGGVSIPLSCRGLMFKVSTRSQ